MSILTQHSEKWIVEVDGPLTNGEPCYLWQRAKTKGGYPKVRRKNAHMDGTCDVHRLVCEEVNGPPPPGKWDASHVCGTRGCVNPAHLIWEAHIHNMHRINKDPDQELDHNGRLVPTRYDYEFGSHGRIVDAMPDYDPDDAITAFS